MTYFTSQQKHNILIHLQSRRSDQSPDDIAALHDVAGGRRTLNNWKRRWNGSAASLERKTGSGRHRLLSTTQVNNLIRTPIKNKNRSHTAVNYPQLLPSIQQKTGKGISLRSLQRYGKRDVGIRMQHTKKRTAAESESTHTTDKCN
jgi:transposase